MICTLTIGSTVLELAGYTGKSSETQGLNISTYVTSEQVSYVGGFEGRQFFRPGSFVSATFNSMLTFSSISEAEFYLASLPTDLVNQTNAIANFYERTSLGVKQRASINCSGTATSDGNVNVTFTSAIVADSPITIAVPILNADDSSIWANKVIAALNANLAIRKRFLIANDGANILVTARIAAANDSTLAIAITNGTPSPGVTPTNSSNVLSGVAPTQIERLTIYDAIAQVSTSHRGATVSLSASISGRTSPVIVGGSEIGTYSEGGFKYRYHKFTQSGQFFTSKPLTVDYLIVGGGGGGGGVVGGGGGGGGVLTGTSTIEKGSYQITVGSGGRGGDGWDTATQNGFNGGDSIFNGNTAIGGGGGSGLGGNTAAAASSGGSGGGGSGLTNGAAGTSGQGYAGGDGANDNDHGAGGGGAGAVGANGTTSAAGDGGIGIASSITGVSTYYAGGGGGGMRYGTTEEGGSGGLGGGGSGFAYSDQLYDFQNGVNGLGGGGGAGGFVLNVSPSTQLGGNGGSGVVIIRYKI